MRSVLKVKQCSGPTFMDSTGEGGCPPDLPGFLAENGRTKLEGITSQQDSLDCRNGNNWEEDFVWLCAACLFNQADSGRP